MTHWHGLPCTSEAEFNALLQAGWTCFLHRGRIWLTTRNRDNGVRNMVPVPGWMPQRAIANGLARRKGIRILPTFTYLQRRSA